jgi:serine protease
MRRLFCLAVLGFAALGVSSAGAQAPSPNNPAPGLSKMLGAVTPFSSHTAGGSRGAGNLKYHAGPVEHTNKVYAIYWVPPGYAIQSGYDTLINRFFGDVAAASGSTTNVYYSDTQYYDSVNGNITYSSSFGGSYTDTNPLPASGCSDSYTSVCLTDAQIASEVQRVVALNGWTPSPTTEFFMFTAKGIGSCLGSQCAFSYYCAYHSWTGSGSNVVLYANMPYADTAPSACDAGQHPNGNDADATLNVTSHEHNETITDEQGNAWYDSAGYENGDKCAWIFGPASGANGAEYNQTINGDHYYLQEEYSNATRSCVQQGT